MNVISAIKQNVKNKNRCSIYVDDEFYMACHMDLAVSMNLKRGTELSAEMEQQLRSGDQFVKLKHKLYGFVMYKPRTRKQVSDYLHKHDVVPEDVERLQDWLHEFRLVDDREFVKNFIEASKCLKPMSQSAIRHRLLAKGVTADDVDWALQNQLTESDLEKAALHVAEKKLKALGKLSEKEQQLKLTQFLKYRGFEWRLVNRVVQSLFVLLLCVSARTLFSQVQSQSPCYKVRIDEAINRYQPTSVPVFTNQNILYLDRKLHPQNRDGTMDADEVWVSNRISGKRFSEPERSAIATFREPDVLFNFTADGLEALVVGDYKYTGSDSVSCFAIISRSSTVERFSRVEPLNIPGLSKLTGNFHGFYSKELQCIFLALERAGGVGDLDIYYASFCNGKWSAPKLLGANINTPLMDSSPWLAPDLRTLYFASNGRADRRGKLDLYITKRIGSGFANWTEPQNLGNCINTLEDDSFLSLFGRSDSAFVSSWDALSGRPGVYLATVPPEHAPSSYCTFTAKIVDAITGQPLPEALISVIPAEDSLKTRTCSLPQYAVDAALLIATTQLTENTQYSIFTSAPGFATHKQIIGVRNLDSTTGIHLNIKLFRKDSPLGSVYFERGSADPSQEQLDSIIGIIKKYEQRAVRFVVTGYTDQLGSTGLNTTLSNQRANAVRLALISLGVPEENISAQGKGIENPGIYTGLKENPQSRRVDIFPSSVVE